MTAILALITIVAVITAKICWTESRWLKSRMDYWYEDARFWRETWEAEHTGDYGK